MKGSEDSITCQFSVHGLLAMWRINSSTLRN